MSGRITFEVTRGALAGQKFEYGEKTRVFIGRQEDCGIVLPESTVSRYHCVLEITPPEVKPEVRCFSMHMNRITTGIVASSDAANRYCHSIMLNDENCVMPTVIGRLAAEEISTVEIVYSFHALMNTKISVVTMPGAAIGSSTCSSEPIAEQPSMRAACSISGEIDTNVPRSNQMANA